jgi:hypothetical protein
MNPDPYIKTLESTEARLERKKLALLRFPIIPIGSIDIKAPHMLVKKYIEAGTQMMAFGEVGVGKTLVAIDMGLSVAVDIPWCGQSVKQGNVLYVCGEGKEGVQRRVLAWSIAHDINISAIPFYISETAANLNDPETMEDVRLSVESLAEKYGPPILVILDTWATNLGGDENSTMDTMIGVNAFKSICTPYHATGLIVHHSGNSEKYRGRGSNALKGALDMEYLVKQSEDKVIHFVNTKVKDFEKPPPLAFRLSTVELGIVDEDGDQITSVVLTPCDHELMKEPKEATGKNQRIMLRILSDILSASRENFQKLGKDPDEAKVSQAEWREATAKEGIAKSSHYDAMKALLSSKKITKDSTYVWIS